MPLPACGPLSLNQIQTEFGGSNPISLSEYYAGGGLVPAGTTGTYGAVPSSGAISIRNFYGTSAIVTGQVAYTTPGTYTWVAPSGVTSVSTVAVGGGGGSVSYLLSGGGGGGLGWKNNISVTPGTGYSVVVGGGGIGQVANATNNGGDSSAFSSVVVGRGGKGSWGGRTGGTYVGDGGGDGGRGGCGASAPALCCFCSFFGAGGGGAGGYANGGAGQSGGQGASPCPFIGITYRGNPGVACSGAGGGGSSSQDMFACTTLASGGGGGGVGLLGKGATGAGTATPTYKYGLGGDAGSGGNNGANGQTVLCSPGKSTGSGGLYGGGAGGAGTGASIPAGAGGAVRIIWPGTTRSFPSTNTGNL